MATSRYGEMLRDGIRVAILGAPNVGKSSLLNRFLGHERALVSPEPGTTRDFIEERVILGPHCFRLIDTAGLNANPAPLERLGMAKTLEKIADADIYLLMLDASAESPALPPSLAHLAADRRAVLVVNKADLLNGEFSYTQDAAIKRVTISATTGSGWGSLVDALIELADDAKPGAEEDVAISARHAQALASARDALSAASEKLVQNEAPELLASDLRSALSALGEIAGRVDNEQVLDALFANFCIGK